MTQKQEQDAKKKAKDYDDYLNDKNSYKGHDPRD